jgi:HEXXH motif-containing protein
MRSLKTPKLGSFALTRAEFISLAEGGGSEAAVHKLTQSQILKRKLLLAGLRKQSGTVSRILEILAGVEEFDPLATRTVLAHPYLDQWAAHWMSSAPDPSEAITYLSVLVAAAAARAGVAFDLDVHTRDGSLFVPTLGRCVDLGIGPVRLTGRAGQVTFTGSANTVVVPHLFEAAPQWEPLRLITLANGPRIAIEDLDPTRIDCYPGMRPLDRLDEPTAASFAEQAGRAWALIARDCPEHATAMNESLTSLTPLANTGKGDNLGATAFRAFGTIAILPDVPTAALASALLHEFMHMKLVAILEQYDLVHDSDGRYYAPWRPDARPALALLHGIYAHFGISGFWRRHQDGADPEHRRAAQFEAALRVRFTADAVRTLRRSGELTPLGQEFVGRIAAVVNNWQRDPVPEDIARAVNDAVYAYRMRWALSHDRLSATEYQRLLATPRPAWCPVDWTPPADALDDPPDAETEPAVAALIRATCTGDAPPGRTPALAAAVAAHLAGDRVAAERGFRAAIDQRDPDGWVGWFVATRATAPVSHPGLVRHLYEAAGGAVDPTEVTAWIVRACRARWWC